MRDLLMQTRFEGDIVDLGRRVVTRPDGRARRSDID
jgi:hypothetical protein